MSTLEDPRVQRYSSPGATSLVVTANETRKLCYSKDDRAMRAI